MGDHTPLRYESVDLAVLLAAWEGGLHAVAALGRALSPQQWAASTECPGWSCGDVVAHLAWIEAMLAGRPDPAHEPDWATLPQADNDFSRMTETGVDIRRGRPQLDVCAELDDMADVRLSQIMRLEPLALDTPVMGVFGKDVPIERNLRMRTFDTWMHEQDIRRAAAMPGALASAGAQCAAVQIAAAIPFMWAKNASAPVGTTLRIDVAGDISFIRFAVVSAEGKGVTCDSVDSPTVAVSTDWETFARLAGGRLDVSDPAVLSRISLSGDQELAKRLPAAFAITP